MLFAAPDHTAEQEEGARLSPRFDSAGLITAVATDAVTGEVLMVAHMNAEALALTIETGVAHYFSRSRGRLWKKGESSGHVQQVAELRIDCDQDAVVLKVRGAGGQAADAACHTGHGSCFFRTIPLGRQPSAELRLETDPRPKRFDPAAVYGGGDKPVS
ncbi:MAG TPA: phosphoribosyl-AMP cyclohydrolase [Xanthobacteraceae bacterium]|nr:phosphoribosyl-AMP cyclohydrolase [Xanthobacteraceae bacterium]